LSGDSHFVLRPHHVPKRAPLGPVTRDLFDGWVRVEAGRTGEELSTLSPLWTTVRLGSSIAAWQLVLDSKIGGGSGALINAMISDGGFEVRTSTPVEKVEQNDHAVQVTTAAGERLSAAAAVIAVPVNCWEKILFEPELSQHKLEGAHVKLAKQENASGATSATKPE